MPGPRVERGLKYPVIGGPHDGILARAAGAFAWIDGEGRAHARPEPGRALYRWQGSRWEHHAGARKCGGCGGILSPDADGWPLDQCPLCGAARNGGDAGAA